MITNAEKVSMTRKSYMLRDSLWSPLFGTSFSGETLEITSCFLSGSKICLIVQNQRFYTTRLEVKATLQINGTLYLALILPADLKRYPDSNDYVTIVKVLSPNNCEIVDAADLDTSMSSKRLLQSTIEADPMQTLIDLIQTNFRIESDLAEQKISPDALEKLGIYLNPYARAISTTPDAYRIELHWQVQGAPQVVLAPLQRSNRHPAVQLELFNVFSSNGKTYCIFVLPAVERAEADQPFFAVLQCSSPGRFVSLTSAECTTLGGTILSACQIPPTIDESVIETCLGPLSHMLPTEADIERLVKISMDY